MNVNKKLRSRYLQDSIPVRLGGLAANLARISSFTKNEGNQDAVLASLQESKWFIEWTADELDIQVADTLIQLQIQLAIWQIQSQKKWDDPGWRFELKVKTQEMSQKILEMSGLLNSKSA